jgi:hypothetical protein
VYISVLGIESTQGKHLACAWHTMSPWEVAVLFVLTIIP